MEFIYVREVEKTKKPDRFLSAINNNNFITI